MGGGGGATTLGLDPQNPPPELFTAEDEAPRAMSLNLFLFFGQLI